MKHITCMCVVLTILAAHVPLRADAACAWKELDATGHTATAGSLVLDLGEADDEQKPTAWQGPITVSKDSQKICTVSDEVSIVSRPLMVVNGRYLYISTYSGSEGVLYVVDSADCAVKWRSPKFVGVPVFKDDSFRLGKEKAIQVGGECLPPSNR
jgi:hypothetical protein